MRSLSTPGWSNASTPWSSGAITSLTFSTAFRTPLPKYLFASPSRSSTASKAPVDAPDGTMARPYEPSSMTTSTSTVGLPRESSTSLPNTCSISIATPPRQPSLSDDQRLAVHLGRFGHAQKVQERRGHVGQPPVAQRDPFQLGYQDARDRMRGVVRMRPARIVVHHLVRVAVVRRDQRRAAHFPHRLHHLADALVHRLHGFHRRLKDSCVAHHVAVGEVDHHQTVLAALNPLDRLFGHLKGAHLRLEIVRRHLGRRDELAVLAGVRLLVPAVEKVGHVGVLLRLRDPQLLPAHPGDD